MGGAEDEKQRIADLEKEIAKRNRWIDQRDRRIDKLEEENERPPTGDREAAAGSEAPSGAVLERRTEAPPEATRTQTREAVWPTCVPPCAAAD